MPCAENLLDLTNRRLPSRRHRAAAGEPDGLIANGPLPECVCVAFPSRLGWFALIGSSRGLRRLSFAHESREAALQAVDARQIDAVRPGAWISNLCRRLQAYAEGEVVDFLDIPLDQAGQTPFRAAVVEACRRIEYGRTVSYGELATAAGSARAARAVGNIMATNPTPLLVPCHRVLGAGGAIGGYSAGRGVGLKRRLLDMEARGIARHLEGHVSR